MKGWTPLYYTRVQDKIIDSLWRLSKTSQIWHGGVLSYVSTYPASTRQRCYDVVYWSKKGRGIHNVISTSYQRHFTNVFQLRSTNVVSTLGLATFVNLSTQQWRCINVVLQTLNKHQSTNDERISNLFFNLQPTSGVACFDPISTLNQRHFPRWV